MLSLRKRTYFRYVCYPCRFIILFSLIAFLLLGVMAEAQQAVPSFVTKTISYKTSKAREVYLIWTVNYWQTPDKQFWPAGTSLKDNGACSKMQRKGDSFYISITLPYGIRSDFYFWIPVDDNGNRIDGWDTKLGNSYVTSFSDWQSIHLDDSKLQISKNPPLNLLERGRWVMIVSFLLLLLAVLLTRQKPRVRLYPLAGALFTSAILFTLLARREIAKTSLKGLIQILGVLSSDLLWLTSMASFFFLLFYWTRQQRRLSIFVFICFVSIASLSVVLSLLNIEVVKQLGTPFTYKWLYYSDFLKGNDARTGAAKTLTRSFILNVTGILAGFVFVALAIYVLFLRIPKPRYWLYASNILFVLLTATSCYCYGIGSLSRSKTQAPVFAFVSSLVNPSSRVKITKQKLPQEAVSYIASFHSHSYLPAFPVKGADQIDNIIVFVSESTPAQYISLFDSNSTYTPGLKRWMRIGNSYSNMYAHIPSTPNSFISLVSGVYPMLDFRSALSENIHLPTPSLPEVLRQHRWNTSLFFSSDLEYAGMGNYARSQKFQSVRDRSMIQCSQQFTTTKTEIDGVNDICTVNNYLYWLDSSNTGKNFSMLWTNQTHSPYYADNRIVFSKENDRLNTYLNALHHTDSVFNYLMQQLDKRGKLKNSLVVFIADHGEAFGTHNQTLHASRIYEENVHIPCIFFSPLFFNGTNSGQIVSLIDIPPTLTHLLGLPKPGAWEGKSLFENAVMDRSFFVSPYTDLIIGTRHGNWKYIFNVDTEEPELYDLSKDPKELNDVSHYYPEIVKKEHEVLIAWFQYVEKNYSNWQYTSKKEKKLLRTAAFQSQ